MNRNNIELGILRLYYVLWALWVAAWLAFCGSQFTRANFHADELALGMAMLVLPPPLLMFAVRWVYRGFLPKKTTV